MRLRLGVAGVQDLLANMLGEQLVQRIVHRQSQSLSAGSQPRRQ